MIVDFGLPLTTSCNTVSFTLSYFVVMYSSDPEDPCPSELGHIGNIITLAISRLPCRYC